MKYELKKKRYIELLLLFNLMAFSYLGIVTQLWGYFVVSALFLILGVQSLILFMYRKPFITLDDKEINIILPKKTIMYKDIYQLKLKEHLISNTLCIIYRRSNKLVVKKIADQYSQSTKEMQKIIGSCISQMDTRDDFSKLENYEKINENYDYQFQDKMRWMLPFSGLFFLFIYFISYGPSLLMEPFIYVFIGHTVIGLVISLLNQLRIIKFNLFKSSYIILFIVFIYILLRIAVTLEM